MCRVASLFLVVAGVTGGIVHRPFLLCALAQPRQARRCGPVPGSGPGGRPLLPLSLGQLLKAGCCVSLFRVNLSVLIFSVLVLFSFFSLLSALWRFLSYTVFWSFLLFPPHFVSWVFS